MRHRIYITRWRRDGRFITNPIRDISDGDALSGVISYWYPPGVDGTGAPVLVNGEPVVLALYQGEQQETVAALAGVESAPSFDLRAPLADLPPSQRAAFRSTLRTFNLPESIINSADGYRDMLVRLRQAIVPGVTDLGGAHIERNADQFAYIAPALAAASVGTPKMSRRRFNLTLAALAGAGMIGTWPRMAKAQPNFSDEFTEASNTDLAAHTPDVGTGWTQEIGSANDMFVNGTDDALEANGCNCVYVSDDQGDADHQMWFRAKAFGTSWQEAFVCNRLVDEDNNIHERIQGTGSQGRRTAKVVTGTITDLITSQSVDEEWRRQKCEGDTISAWEGGTGGEPASPEEDTNWTQVGSNQTVSDHNTETSQGVATQSGGLCGASSPWIDSFRAHTIPAAGGGASNVIPIWLQGIETIQ